MKEVYLYKKLAKKIVKCNNCSRYCVIAPNKRELCGVRQNLNGTLFALNYGKIISLQINPIEKNSLPLLARNSNFIYYHRWL